MFYNNYEKSRFNNIPNIRITRAQKQFIMIIMIIIIAAVVTAGGGGVYSPANRIPTPAAAVGRSVCVRTFPRAIVRAKRGHGNARAYGREKCKLSRAVYFQQIPK